jgi:hypothetical protein
MYTGTHNADRESRRDRKAEAGGARRRDGQAQTQTQAQEAAARITRHLRPSSIHSYRSIYLRQHTHHHHHRIAPAAMSSNKQPTDTQESPQYIPLYTDHGTARHAGPGRGCLAG